MNLKRIIKIKSKFTSGPPPYIDWKSNHASRGNCTYCEVRKCGFASLQTNMALLSIGPGGSGMQ